MAGVCACVDVGAPHVTVCSVRRRESSGWPACELCSRRLSTCKGKLYQHGAGKICSSCYKIREGYQAAPVGVPPPPIQRSHKKKESSSVAPAASVLWEAIPSLEEPLLQQQRTFCTHGWAFQPGHRNSRAMAAGWITLVTSSELKAWKQKRGGY